MNGRAMFLAASLAVTTACGARDPVDSAVIPPNKILDFGSLYANNCSGCHGPNGRGGLAIGLADSVYLAIADDSTILRITADGVPGTSMAAFAQHSGGMLTDDQINVIIRGIRTWAKPDTLRDANPPPYAGPSPGDPKRGAAAYGVYCASCHGPDGHGAKASSIVGRPELGAPDWRGDVPGKAMSPDEISDVVSWLAAQRLQISAQVTGGTK
jgi:cytochrome c oxidase cbb3-type subunit III